MFIQTEDTPNPATMKFRPGCDVLGATTGGSLDVTKAKAPMQSPLAEALFAIDGVTGVFLGSDFITVTRAADKTWPTLKPAILGVIMEHFAAGKPVLAAGAEKIEAAGDDESEDSPTIRMIREILDHRIRPALAMDGGDVGFEGFEDGVVYLRLKGACAGCPGANATLKMGVENVLRHFIPEVKEVRQVR